MTVYRAYLHLGSDEWGNEFMTKVADAYAKEHADKRPLIVSVHEHAAERVNSCETTAAGI
jgi:hypothetical protein